VLHAGDPGIAERAEEDGRALELDGHPYFRRKRRSVTEIPLGAEIEIPQLQGQTALFPIELEEGAGLLHHLRSDAVAAEEGDLSRRGH
jgi:hypothetical protein